jgi:hypothetical protein
MIRVYSRGTGRLLQSLLGRQRNRGFDRFTSTSWDMDRLSYTYTSRSLYLQFPSRIRMGFLIMQYDISLGFSKGTERGGYNLWTTCTVPISQPATLPGTGRNVADLDRFLNLKYHEERNAVRYEAKR